MLFSMKYAFNQAWKYCDTENAEQHWILLQLKLAGAFCFCSFQAQTVDRSLDRKRQICDKVQKDSSDWSISFDIPIILFSPFPNWNYWIPITLLSKSLLILCTKSFNLFPSSGYPDFSCFLSGSRTTWSFHQSLKNIPVSRFLSHELYTPQSFPQQFQS